MSANFGWSKLMESPLVNVAGAYFPAWLFCLLAALLVFGALQLLLPRTRWCGLLTPPLLMIPVWLVLLSCGIWLLFFSA